MMLSKRKDTGSGSFKSLMHSCLTLAFSALLGLYPGCLECSSCISERKEWTGHITLLAVQTQTWRRQNSTCSLSVWYLIYMEFFGRGLTKTITEIWDIHSQDPYLGWVTTGPKSVLAFWSFTFLLNSGLMGDLLSRQLRTSGPSSIMGSRTKIWVVKMLWFGDC